MLYENKGQHTCEIEIGHVEAATGGVLWKKVFLKDFTKFIGRSLC